MALALPLLVAAALSVLTVHRFLNGPQGFNPDGLLTMRLQLPDARYPNAETRREVCARPSSIACARCPASTRPPRSTSCRPADNNSGRSIEIEGVPNPDPANPPSVDYRTATPDLFATLRDPDPCRAGRSPTPTARTRSRSRSSPSRSRGGIGPDADPIGKRIKTGTGPWLTVVGVSGDVIHDWFGRRNYPTLYRPFRQAPTSNLALIVRTSRDPSTLAADARAAVRAVDPSQAVFDVRSMRQALQERTLGLQYVGAIMLVFGGLALLLAVVGVYGVMAHMVTQRTHEIGVRMALGATRRDVLRLTVGQTGTADRVGVGIGLVLSLLLGRLIEAGLLGVASSDARITAGLAAILVAVVARRRLPPGAPRRVDRSDGRAQGRVTRLTL